MPVKIQDGLPAVDILRNENIFVMTEHRASTQDIRPLRIAALNLMPLKTVTETQLLRVLSNTPLQVELTFLTTSSYQPRNIDSGHLNTFYKTFNDVKGEQFDGLIITGAPVEQMPFEHVAYWTELIEVLEWARENVFSALFICWAAQAALYHYYKIDKRQLSKKLFGVFPHKVENRTNKLVSGFDDTFYMPHSRHTTVSEADLRNHSALEVLATSKQGGVAIAASRDGRRVFVTGHGEYDANTLELEYKRDLQAGQPIEMPCNYYPNNDSSQPPKVLWRAHGNLLFGNWLNYFVYQETPYIVQKIGEFGHDV